MSSASNEGRQSPDPSTQSGAQLHDTPASGQGTDKAPNKKEGMEDQLKGLSSNPKGPVDDALEDKFKKDGKSGH
ncbi:Uu.00g131440.m01.CDS01 [Anthostomella pinea]|uniref:Uu.00g131440.m01.CDS01 n=1 Tax=Anthostomella pinea TaxID=933095 RepID=A0AAI8VIV7_9PEZI|nr:Uu.00g131440.m01.CDS01 [Anthostomella pinea]